MLDRVHGGLGDHGPQAIDDGDGQPERRDGVDDPVGRHALVAEVARHLEGGQRAPALRCASVDGTAARAIDTSVMSSSCSHAGPGELLEVVQHRRDHVGVRRGARP